MYSEISSEGCNEFGAAFLPPATLQTKDFARIMQLKKASIKTRVINWPLLESICEFDVEYLAA